jgi:hypothetical protein
VGAADNLAGLSREELIASYDDRALITVRLQRLQEYAGACCRWRYYSRPSFFLGFAVIRLLQRIVYGRR